MNALTLREARKRAHLTQDELAEKTGLDQTTISSIEIGRHTNPSPETVQRLAKALGIAPSRLRFSTPQPDDSVKPDSDRAGQAVRPTNRSAAQS